MPLGRTPTKSNQEMDKNSEESQEFLGFEDQVPVREAMGQLVPLFRLRNQVLLKVSRIHDIVENELVPVTLAQLRVFTKKLQSAYDEFSGFHSQIIAVVSESDMRRQEEEYIHFENLFDTTAAIVESLLMSLEKPQATQQSSTPQVIIHQQPLKAPIPTFDGDYAKWPKFKAMFQDVMAQSRDSDAIKLYHLDKALTDKAAGVLDAKTINEGNYEQAWRILTERYENQRIIVETHIRGLLSLPRMKSESNTELRDLIDKCNNHVESLEYLKQQVVGVSELMIIFLLTSALDKATRKQWEQTMMPGELPNYKSTIDFLRSQCQVLERCEEMYYPSPQKTFAPKPTTTKIVSQRSHAATSIQEASNDKCDFCGESHRNFQCNKLNALSSSEKIEKVRSAGVCFNCLRKGHRSKECPSSKTCRKCQRRHHTQLHEDAIKRGPEGNFKNEDNSPKTTPTIEIKSVERADEPNVSSTCSCNHVKTTKTVLLLTAVVLVMDKHAQPHQCRVLLDSGSQVNFLTERMATLLGIPKQRTSVPIAGINNLRTIARDKVEVEFQSRCSEYRAKLECLVTPEITGRIPSTTIDVEEWDIPCNIMLADPEFFKPEKIDMLIGIELFFNLLKPSSITNNDNLPELRDSHLGWLVTGTVNSHEKVRYSQVVSIQSVEESMQQFWQVEEVTDAATLSSEEQRCEEHFVSTHSRDATGRFIVRLPFKDNVTQLDSCRALALKRFFMLEHRFQRNPELKAQYVDFIREYRLLHHCRQVDESKDNPLLKPYYMPHHAVLRPDSSTTKCRVVFDASAKQSPTSLSLNDVLLVGPVVQNDLFAIMLRFRKHRYVFTADISKMYRQIHVHPDDTHYQRIFWRENSTDRLEVLELTTVTYGTASAPFQATRSLVQLAQNERNTFPVAADIILKDTYVDDLLSGSETVQQATNAIQQLKTMLSSAGFPMHKWCSNSPTVLEHIPIEEQETPKPIEERNVNNAIKILGLLWEPTSDKFYLASKLISNFPQPATKRKIYSEVAKLFDPLGLFSPTIVQAKLLVQQLWRLNMDWDDPINDEMNKKWNELNQSLPQLMEIKIPRQVTFYGAACYEIHGFADASNVAYGACIYIRSLYSGEVAKSRLLCSKSKVAPLHELTIPRKELCAALLLSRLIKKVIAAIDIDFKQVILWSDSQIVLAWLTKHPDRLEIFVRNRVAEIITNTDGFKWNYVRSQQNPADVISRGQSPAMLSDNNLWWNGPEFLTQQIIVTESTIEISDDDLPELKPLTVVTTAVIKQQLPLFSKFSCFRKLQRVVAWILRFKHNANKKNRRIILRHLTVNELRQSMLVIVRVIQHVELAEDIRRLESNQPCKRISALNPFYTEGVLRVGGRLKHSKLPETSKHQLILPNTSPVTKLLIWTIHQELHHLGTSGLIAAIRQRFWLLNARSTVRQVTRSCLKCFRTKPSGNHQLMGELPKQRVTPSPPFSITGVDYAGPINVKQGSHRPKIMKAYIAVFVCMATKAVHLELVSNMTTDAFIAALQRFISRRGMVAEIHSDNGTNFVGANRELQQLYKGFQNQHEIDRLKQFCHTKELEWYFIPPDAPEFGGLWEAAVKSAKTHMKRVIGNVILTFEEMSTILCEIEAILNSRPLFAISNDPADPEVITPGHFLIGRPLTAMPEPSFKDDVKINRLSRWQHIQLMRHHFWTAWSRDYLSTLQPRKKNWNTTANVKPGMLVYLHDRNSPALQWRLGRVLKVYVGVDNLVRVVDVFCDGKTFRRPVTKLSVLPIQENQRLLFEEENIET